MMPVRRFLSIAAAVLLVAPVPAQGPPDFSGRWTLAPEPPAAAGARPAPAPGSGWGPELTIAQDGQRLTIEFPLFGRYDMQPPVRLVYLLDGSESTNSIDMGRGPQPQVSKTAWDASRLTITTVRAFRAAPDELPMTIETIHVLSLDPAGSLVVETTHGGALGGRPSTARAVYKRN
jgi:hypothetical protein